MSPLHSTTDMHTLDTQPALHSLLPTHTVCPQTHLLEICTLLSALFPFHDSLKAYF